MQVFESNKKPERRQGKGGSPLDVLIFRLFFQVLGGCNDQLLPEMDCKNPLNNWWQRRRLPFLLGKKAYFQECFAVLGRFGCFCMTYVRYQVGKPVEETAPLCIVWWQGGIWE